MDNTSITEGFVAMVEAYKAKPELESQIKHLSEDNAMCYQTIDLLRQQIADLQGKVSSTETRLSEVTKERDDASFRNLELDEKLAGIEKLLGLAERLEQARRDEHQATVNAMTPKPEPVQEPQPIEAYGFSGPIDPVVVEGQSVVDPMPSNATDSAQFLSQETGTAFAEPDTRPINPYSGFPIHYPDGEYRGQPYYDKPSWVSWAAWVDAGGEAEPYMQQVVR